MCEHVCARVNLSQELQAGLLTVVEQVPGLTVAADKTATLERGYWPSYNVPFFPEVTGSRVISMQGVLSEPVDVENGVCRLSFSR